MRTLNVFVNMENPSVEYDSITAMGDEHRQPTGRTVCSILHDRLFDEREPNV